MIGIHWYNTSNNRIWNVGMSYETVCSTIVVTIGGEPPLTARERLRICGTLFRCLCTRPGSGLLVELRVSAKMVVYHELIWYVSVNVRYWYGMYAKNVSDVLAYDGQQWSNKHWRNMATPIVFIFVSCILNDRCWTQKHLGPALCSRWGFNIQDNLRSFGNHHLMTYRVCLQVMSLTIV